MSGRANELRQLLDGLLSGSAPERDEARSIGMALRGSGSTFGFPEVSDAAALVESARDEDLLRRVEGLIGQLGALSGQSEDGTNEPTIALPPEWLVRAAGLGDTLHPSWAADGGWTPLARSAGIDLTELARRAADYLGIDVADLADRRPSALRLVPEAFVTSAAVVPLREDSETITVASADPTALSDEWELELLTGRRPVFVIAPPEAIEAIIEEMYGRDAAAEQGRDATKRPPATSPAPPPEAAPPTSSDDPGGRTEAPVPEMRAEELQSSSRPPSDSTAAEGAVLVVDDEPSARLLVRAVLERRGYEVIEADDGLAALEALDRTGVGLVVADLNMPRMDGLELIWELRDAHPSVRLPVIVVTGEADEILETQLMEEGADDYIRKPIDPRLFLARVESTVRRLGARVSQTSEEGAGG